MKNPPLPIAYLGALKTLKEGALTLLASVTGAAQDMPDDAQNDVRLAVSILDQCSRLEKEAKGV